MRPLPSRLAALLVAAVFSGAVHAQAYPSKPVQVIVPFAPTGSTSIVVRAVGPQLGEHLGQPVVIMNRPGGAATIGMGAVAKSPADGYTVGVATLSFAANPAVMEGKMPFDTEKDLAPVAMLAKMPMVLVVHPSLPARSVKELVAAARAKPGALNYGSAGIASSGHLGGALFELLAEVKMTHVPFSSTGSGGQLVGGHTDLQISPIPSVLGFIKNGQLIALGVASLTPDPVLPGVPTVAEGVKGYEAFDWMGLVVPAGTPRPVIDRLQQATVKALEDKEVRQRITGVGAQVSAGTTEAFAAFVKAELAKWRKVGAQVREETARKG